MLHQRQSVNVMLAWVLAGVFISSVVGQECPAKWVAHDKTCMRILKASERNWEEAKDLCEELDGTLLRINSEKTLRRLADWESIPLWIGSCFTKECLALEPYTRTLDSDSAMSRKLCFSIQLGMVTSISCEDKMKVVCQKDLISPFKGTPPSSSPPTPTATKTKRTTTPPSTVTTTPPTTTIAPMTKTTTTPPPPPTTTTPTTATKTPTTTTTETTTLPPTTTTPTTTIEDENPNNKVPTVGVKKDQEQPRSEKACKDSWRHYGAEESCIKLFSIKETWDDSRTICQAQDGDLVTVLTTEKKQFLFDEFRPSKDSFYWIGAYKMGLGDSSKTMTSMRSIYRDWWHLHQCPAIQSSDLSSFHGDRKALYVCEMFVKSTPRMPDNPCRLENCICNEKDWLYIKEREKFIKLNKVPNTFTTSARICEKLGGQLLVDASKEVLTTIDESPEGFLYWMGRSNGLGKGTGTTRSGQDSHVVSRVDYCLAVKSRDDVTLWPRSCLSKQFHICEAREPCKVHQFMFINDIQILDQDETSLTNEQTAVVKCCTREYRHAVSKLFIACGKDDEFFAISFSEDIVEVRIPITVDLHNYNCSCTFTYRDGHNARIISKINFKTAPRLENEDDDNRTVLIYKETARTLNKSIAEHIESVPISDVNNPFDNRSVSTNSESVPVYNESVPVYNDNEASVYFVKFSLYANPKPHNTTMTRCASNALVGPHSIHLLPTEKDIHYILKVALHEFERNDKNPYCLVVDNEIEEKLKLTFYLGDDVDRLSQNISFLKYSDKVPLLNDQQLAIVSASVGTVVIFVMYYFIIIGDPHDRLERIYHEDEILYPSLYELYEDKFESFDFETTDFETTAESYH